MRVVHVVAGLLVSALLAGCAGEAPASTEGTPVPESIQEVEVTKTTGAIRGIVYDETITPITGVLVVIAGGANTTTDDDGAFVFTGLEPGDYFITASKLGYTTIQQSTTVVAGVADPAITKILLAADAATRPYVEVLPWAAFLQCGAYIVAGSVNPCFLTGSDNVHTFEFGGGRIPDYLLLEAVWEGTQPLGNNLWIMTLEANGQDREANGESNLFVNATKDQIIAAYGEDATAIQVRLFPGVADDGTPTVVTNQKYDIYVSYFYGFTPRADYLFALEGNCMPVEMCM